MILSEEKCKEFIETVKPAMKWLNDNCHPHVSIIITPTNAELFVSVCSTGFIDDYIKD